VESVSDRVELIRSKLPDLTSLHDALSQGKLHKDIRIKSQKILIPYKGFGKRTVDAIIREIVDERVECCCELIVRQNALADVGILRAHMLRGMYDFYVQDVLEGQIVAANLDIWQQEFDVSLMFVLSDSQLKFAKAYARDGPEKIAKYERMVAAQEKTLLDFKGGQLGDPFLTPVLGERQNFSATEREEFLRNYQLVTLDVAMANLELCEATLRLFENQARAIYYWRLSLRDIEQSPMGKVFMPHDDLNFESELQKIYLERCQILAERAHDLTDLAARVVNQGRAGLS